MRGRQEPGQRPGYADQAPGRSATGFRGRSGQLSVSVVTLLGLGLAIAYSLLMVTR